MNECRYFGSEALARVTAKYVGVAGAFGRYMSTTPHSPETNTGEAGENCIRKWDYQVTPFGRLIVNTSDHLDVRIESLCPDKYPHMDRFVMDVWNPGGVPASFLDRVECKQQNQNIVVTVSDDDSNDRCSTAQCHIQMPVKFGEYFP